MSRRQTPRQLSILALAAFAALPVHAGGVSGSGDNEVDGKPIYKYQVPAAQVPGYGDLIQFIDTEISAQYKSFGDALKASLGTRTFYYFPSTDLKDIASAIHCPKDVAELPTCQNAKEVFVGGPKMMAKPAEGRRDALFVEAVEAYVRKYLGIQDEEKIEIKAREIESVFNQLPLDVNALKPLVAGQCLYPNDIVAAVPAALKQYGARLQAGFQADLLKRACDGFLSKKADLLDHSSPQLYEYSRNLFYISLAPFLQEGLDEDASNYGRVVGLSNTTNLHPERVPMPLSCLGNRVPRAKAPRIVAACDRADPVPVQGMSTTNGPSGRTGGDVPASNAARRSAGNRSGRL